MSGLSRVPSGGSPIRRVTEGLVAVALVVVVGVALEPWAAGTEVRPAATEADGPSAGSASPAGQGSASPAGPEPASPRAAAPTRTYDPAAFGAAPDDAVWTIRTSSVTVTMPSLGVPDDGSVISGPVVGLGRAGSLGALVISGPAGSRLDAIRLWRFADDRDPERLALDRLDPPWPTGTAWTVGLRAGRPTDDLVGAWQPGLYRLDLLVMPAARIRTVMLVVDDAIGRADPPTVAPETDAPAAFRLSLLARLPDAATVWTYGEILTGWARGSSAGDCAIAALWVARDPDDACWPVPIGRASALGVNLPDGRVAERMELVAVDPLPGAIETRTAVGVAGRPGVAAAWAPAGGLPDGIYRVTVGIRGGDAFHWYAEVGPSSRQTEAINVFVAGG